MDYLEIIKTQDYKEIKKIFDAGRPTFTNGIIREGTATRGVSDPQIQAIYEYKVENHDIFDKTARPDKIIYKDSGDLDANGNPRMVRTPVPVARIGVPFQELIVERRVGFMLSDPIKVDPIYTTEGGTDNEKRLEKLIERIQNDNKMDYRNKEIARRMMSELECAELWYLVPNDEPDDVLKSKFTLKLRILSPDLGDKLYPLFDDYGSMVAFAREYKLRDGQKEIEHFDVYTAEFEYKYINKDGEYKLDDEALAMTTTGERKAINPVPNPVKKIMVIYHSQQKPEWAKVQSMISRFEELISNHADMNDYFGSPILAVYGDILGFAQKGEQGKILQLTEQAKANYLALGSPPESIKMELENLDREIYGMSQTPDISFQAMMNIGGQLSGIALKMMFLDAHMAVKNKEEIYGIGIQRRLNLLKAVIGTILDTSLQSESKTLQLKPVITPYLPQNITEMLENLTVSINSGIISQETAVELNPLVTDPETEMKRIDEESAMDMAGGEQLPGSGTNAGTPPQNQPQNQ